MMMVCPHLLLLLRSNARTSPPPARESRFPVGSSPKATSGRVSNARATATRCCWPPESSWGPVLQTVLEPSVVTTVSSHPASAVVPAKASGSVMFCSAVKVGTRLNAWKTKPIRSRRKAVS